MTRRNVLVLVGILSAVVAFAAILIAANPALLIPGGQRNQAASSGTPTVDAPTRTPTVVVLGGGRDVTGEHVNPSHTEQETGHVMISPVTDEASEPVGTLPTSLVWPAPVEPTRPNQHTLCVIEDGSIQCSGHRVGPPQPAASTWWMSEPQPVPVPDPVEVAVSPEGLACASSGSDTTGWSLWCWGEGVNVDPPAVTGRNYQPTTDPVLIWSGPDLDAFAMGMGYVCIVEGDAPLVWTSHRVLCWGRLTQGPQIRASTGALIAEGLIADVIAGNNKLCWRTNNTWSCRTR